MRRVNDTAGRWKEEMQKGRLRGRGREKKVCEGGGEDDSMRKKGLRTGI